MRVCVHYIRYWAAAAVGGGGAWKRCPPRSGNGGTGDPLARRRVGSVCTLTSIFSNHYQSVLSILEKRLQKEEGKLKRKSIVISHTSSFTLVVAVPLSARRIMVCSGVSSCVS
jgi:hypothetical protein